MPSPFLEVLAAILGLLLGSFLNVCITRLPRGESIATPRSHCRICNAPIRWYDNLPVISWIRLRARCRSCHQPIPWRYPVVELASALWFLILGIRLQLFLDFARNIDFGLPPNIPIGVLGFISLAVLGLLLLAFIVIDWQHHLLPNALTFSGIFVALFLLCSQAIFLGPNEDQIHLNPRHSLRMSSPGSTMARGDLFLTGPEHLLYGRLLAIVAVTVLLLLIRWIYSALRHREGLGLGDVKLLAMIAAFLGLAPSLLALFVGVLLASLYAVTLLATGRASALTRLPFGSFLGVGGLLSALFGTELLAWYTSLL